MSCIKEFETINKITNIITKYQINDYKKINDNDIIINVTFNIFPINNVLVKYFKTSNFYDINYKFLKKLFNNNYDFCINHCNFNNETYITKYNLTQKKITNNQNFNRRHIQLSNLVNTYFNKNVVMDYNTAFNEYNWLPFEKFFLENIKINYKNIEVYFPFFKHEDFKNILKKYTNHIFSFMLRCTKVDNIIHIKNCKIIIWIDIIIHDNYANDFINYIKKNNCENLYNFHKGKYII
jgi:hypothetical protein